MYTLFFRLSSRGIGPPASVPCHPRLAVEQMGAGRQEPSKCRFRRLVAGVLVFPGKQSSRGESPVDIGPSKEHNHRRGEGVAAVAKWGGCIAGAEKERRVMRKPDKTAL